MQTEQQQVTEWDLEAFRANPTISAPFELQTDGTFAQRDLTERKPTSYQEFIILSGEQTCDLIGVLIYDESDAYSAQIIDLSNGYKTLPSWMAHPEWLITPNGAFGLIPDSYADNKFMAYRPFKMQFGFTNNV